MLFGAAESFGAAASGRTLVGLGVSVVFVAMLKLNANWFHERWFATAAGFGNVIGIIGAEIFRSHRNRTVRSSLR